MMKLTVEYIKQDGTAFKSGGQWYNLSKYAEGLSLNGINVNDEIEVNDNVKTPKGNWVTSLKSFSTAVTSNGHKVEQPTKRINGDAREEIARSTALKAVSMLLSRSSGDDSQKVSDAKGLAQQFTRYILTGNFSEDNGQ